MKTAELFVRCLENEGVEAIFGIPGEENLDVMDVLHDSSIRFITTRHEQGAAFMANVYGRLTGRAGVCLSTRGPGATNMVTGVADANIDRAPLVAITGQVSTTRMHKESSQRLDLVNLFRPITKFSGEILDPENCPEIVRKAFEQAQTERPGAAFIELPEDIARMEMAPMEPLPAQRPTLPQAPEEKIRQAADLISEAGYPVIIAGNGVIRSGACDQLVQFAQTLNIPVATTFMANGAIPFSHRLSLGSVGLQMNDSVASGLDRADVIVCIGYDMVEYPPNFWHTNKSCRIVHIDATAPEVDGDYVVAAAVVGDVGSTLSAIADRARPQEEFHAASLRQTIIEELGEHAADRSFPLMPQKIVWDLRQTLGVDDIIVSDVGAHKMWMARMYQAETPNSCIISNGFASMGIGLPGAIAAKFVHPERTVVAVTGDAGFMMNSQELETALRLKTPLVVVVWNDGEYGLIKSEQMREFGRASYVDFGNPDFVKFAESFGAKGYRIEQADELVPAMKQAVSDDTVVVIDCPVDYSENLRLTEKLGELVCPI